MVGQSQMLPRSGQWQTAFMLNQIPGIPKVTPPFKGTLNVTALGGTRFSGPPPVCVIALRARYNERGDLLLTSTPPLQDGFFTPSPELLFPHFTVGGGFETQFLLMPFGQFTGTMYFFDQSGSPLSLPMQ